MRKLYKAAVTKEEFSEEDLQWMYAAASFAARSGGGGEYLAELMPDVYTAHKFTARIAEAGAPADQSQHACFLCVASSHAEYRLIVSNVRNLSEQWKSHCCKHHPGVVFNQSIVLL